MKTTHTPGPWGLRHSGKTVVSLPHTSPEAREVIACSIENTANARLIAAAPELLDALRDAISQAKWYGPRNPDELGGKFACEVIAKAEAAIARATQP